MPHNTMTTTKTDALMALADRYAFHIPGSQHSDEARAALLAALQEQAREGEVVAIKDAVGCVLEGWTLPEPVRKILETAYYAAPQPAQPEQGELAGPDQIEKIVDRYVDEYEFTDGENAYHSPNEFEQMLIKDAFYGLLVDEEWDAAWGAHIASLQSAQPVALPNIQNQIVKDISRHEPCHTCAHYQQGKLPGVRIHDETCYECRSYWGNKWEAA